MCLVVLYNRRISICKFLPVFFSFTCVQFPWLLPNKRVHISFLHIYLRWTMQVCPFSEMERNAIVVRHYYAGIEIPVLTNFYFNKHKSKLVLLFSFIFITIYSWNNTFDLVLQNKNLVLVKVIL